MQFTENQQKKLLAYAREVLIETINNGRKTEKKPPDPIFLEKAGVFVSLHKDGELRGCIGYIEPIASIWDAIAENTISAATADFRFQEVSADELGEIKIEISILTPPVSCALNDIAQGKDGVIIQDGAHKATYLPQVWNDLKDNEQFFSSLCQKAELDSNCWHHQSTKFYKYNAIVFSE